MEYTDTQIRKFIAEVVSEAKSSARVDTGFLKRSIRGNLFKGVITFREIFYGAYNGNSKLVEIATRIMPKDLKWKVIFVDEEGREKTIKGQTRTGRTVRRSSIGTTNQSTSKIKQLLSWIRNYGSKKDDTGKGN